MDKHDLDAFEVASSKELDVLFTKIATSFKEKEDEHNWEQRHKLIVQLRRLLRGSAPDAHLEAVVAGIRLAIDGIIKSAESLRTTLALDSLQLIADIGTRLPRSLDSYMYEQCLQCLIKAASVAKKIVALQSKDAMVQFLQHANYYAKTPQLLWLSINEKNNQVRHFTMLYALALLQAHGPKESVRQNMDRHGGTELMAKILQKALVDATPIVRQASRDPFWLFWHFWPERGDTLLRNLTPAIRKPLESSKAAALALLSASVASPTISSSSDTKQRRAATLPPPVVKQQQQQQQQQQQRPMSPAVRGLSSQSLGRQPSAAGAMPTARKSKVPAGLLRKKSMASLKRKQTLLSMLQTDDPATRTEGLQTLARKLSGYDLVAEYPLPMDLIQIDDSIGHEQTRPVDGAALQAAVCALLAAADTNVLLYEQLTTWEVILGIIIKLVPFDDHVPRWMLDAAVAPHDKKGDDWLKFRSANKALARVQWCLKRCDHSLADRIYTGLAGVYGAIKLKPMDRRKLTRQWLVWMDQLVLSMIGLDNDEDEDAWLLEEDATTRQELDHRHWLDLLGPCPNVASAWFESDSNVRRCLELLIPALQKSAPGSISHDPLVSLVGHLRLVNQKLFDMYVQSLGDDATVSKICRVLGIHLKYTPPTAEFQPDTPLIGPMGDHDLPGKEDEPILHPAHDDQESFHAESLATNALFIQPEITLSEVARSEPPVSIPLPPTEISIDTSVHDAPQNRDTEPLVPDVPQPLPSSLPEADILTRSVSPPTQDIHDQLAPLNDTLYESPSNHANVDVNAPIIHPVAADAPLSLPILNDTNGLNSPETPVTQMPLVETPFAYFSGHIKHEEDVHPVFARNVRSDGKGRANTLYQTLDKWVQVKDASQHEHEHVSLIKKLMRLSKESPIQKRWDQGGADEQHADLWESGNKDGGNFVELMQTLLDQVAACKSCRYLQLELAQQLVTAQSGLLRYYERKLDEQGRSLESRLIEQAICRRADPDPTISAAADDLMEALLLVLDPQTIFDVLLAFLGQQLLSASSPPEDTTRHVPIASAFLFLGKAVHLINNTVIVEEWMSQGGAAVLIRGLNHELIQVRKNGVMAMVEFQEILGDTIYLFLGDLRQDQLNLIKYYANKSVKKKASIRQLSANGQLR
ncbi:clasp N terminal-domain-containing protein [Gongronella butleri]|nr:clasp N terminal-domain-containing protein [Gongronella butleri]